MSVSVLRLASFGAVSLRWVGGIGHGRHPSPGAHARDDLRERRARRLLRKRLGSDVPRHGRSSTHLYTATTARMILLAFLGFAFCIAIVGLNLLRLAVTLVMLVINVGLLLFSLAAREKVR